jgi:WD40 repeat protein
MKRRFIAFALMVFACVSEHSAYGDRFGCGTALMAEQGRMESEEEWSDKILAAYRSLLSQNEIIVGTDEIREMIRRGTPFILSDVTVSEASPIRNGLIELGAFTNDRIKDPSRLNNKLLSYLKSILVSRGREQSRTIETRRRRSDAKLPYRVLTGHSGDLRAAIFSPDEQFLLAGCGKEAIVWETESGKIKQKWTNHTGAIWSTEFSYGGRHAVIEARNPTQFGSDGGLMFYKYDVASGVLMFGPEWRPQKNISPPGGVQVMVSNESVTITTWSDGSLSLNERFRSTRIHTPHGGDGNIIHLALSPQSKFLFTASKNLLLLWNFEEVLGEAD